MSYLNSLSWKRDQNYNTYGYGLISNYTVIKEKPSDILNIIDNTRFYAIDVELWCIWENDNSFKKNNSYEHNNNHGIISFINSCLGVIAANIVVTLT